MDIEQRKSVKITLDQWESARFIVNGKEADNLFGIFIPEDEMIKVEALTEYGNTLLLDIENIVNAGMALRTIEEEEIKNKITYPKAAELLKDNFAENIKYSVSSRLDFWATSKYHIIDTINDPLKVDLPPGNGIYETTQLERPSTLEETLLKLRRMQWAIVDNKFVQNYGSD